MRRIWVAGGGSRRVCKVDTCPGNKGELIRDEWEGKAVACSG